MLKSATLAHVVTQCQMHCSQPYYIYISLVWCCVAGGGDPLISLEITLATLATLSLVCGIELTITKLGQLFRHNVIHELGYILNLGILYFIVYSDS